MVAAPFKVSMVVRNRNNQTKAYRLTASDVANEYLIFDSGGSEVPITMAGGVIQDMILSAAGTDTTQLELYINGMKEGTVLLNATSIATTVGRPLQQAPVTVPAGATVRWKQLA